MHHVRVPLLILVIKLLSIISAVFSAKCGESFVTEGGRIVGGREAKPGETPWLVALFKKKLNGNYSHFCGASILNEQWVITAAHCVFDVKLEVMKGAVALHNIKSTNKVKEIFFDRKIVHEEYNVGNLDEPINDIALLHMNSSIEINRKNNLTRICLPKQREEFKKMMEVAGWGKVHEFGEASEVLKIAQVFKVNDSDCRTAYRNAFHKKEMFCAGNALRRIDSCEGDSGGPLVKRINDKYYLAGIVSFGKGCARKRYTGIYTRVSNYIDWIIKNTSIDAKDFNENEEEKSKVKLSNLAKTYRKSKSLRYRDPRFRKKGIKKSRKLFNYIGI